MRLAIAIGVVVTELVLAIALIMVLAGHVRAHGENAHDANTRLISYSGRDAA